MSKFTERVFRKKPKAPKRVYTKEEIHARNKYGYRARDYLYLILATLITFIIIYYYYHWDMTKSILMTILVDLILLILLRKITAKEEVEEREGWLITWIDPAGFYTVQPQDNMKIVYGKARKLPDGSLESIPESFVLTYHRKKANQRRLNPMMPQSMNHVKWLQEQGEDVFFCDGTDWALHPLEAMNKRISVKESQGLTAKAIKRTTRWMGSRKGVVAD
jgi:hypothetical protein